MSGCIGKLVAWHVDDITAGNGADRLGMMAAQQGPGHRLGMMASQRGMGHWLSMIMTLQRGRPLAWHDNIAAGKRLHPHL